MNITLFKRLIEVLETYPQYADMTTYGHHGYHGHHNLSSSATPIFYAEFSETAKRAMSNDCRFYGSIEGLAVAFSDPADVYLDANSLTLNQPSEPGECHLEDLAASLLGLEGIDCRPLFNLDCWPHDLQMRCDDATLAGETEIVAECVIERLKRFMADSGNRLDPAYFAVRPKEVVAL